MVQYKSTNVDSLTTIIAVAPEWLQKALSVLVQASPAVEFMACQTSVDSLLAMDFSSPPDVVLLNAAKSDARVKVQVQKVKLAWPDAKTIVLVENNRQMMMANELGVDVALLKGAAAQRLLNVINTLGASPEML